MNCIMRDSMLEKCIISKAGRNSLKIYLYTTKINPKESHVQYLLKFNICLFCAGLPWWLSGKESYCNAGYTNLTPGLGRSSGERMQTTPVYLPGKSHGQRSLVGYSPWGCKESDMAEWLSMRVGTWLIEYVPSYSHSCPFFDVYFLKYFLTLKIILLKTETFMLMQLV